MASSNEENCHLCECPAHAEEFETRKIHIGAAVKDDDVGTLKTLLDFSTWYENNDECSSPLSHTAILESCCEIHQVTKSADPDFLLVACRALKFKTVQFLLETGFNVDSGAKYLHECYRGPFLSPFAQPSSRRNAIEAMIMLIWHGADPMITEGGNTVFDAIVPHVDDDPFVLTALEDIFHYTFDRHTEYIHAETLFTSLELFGLDAFDEIVTTNTPKVLFTDFISTDYDFVDTILMMEPQCLQFMVENFDFDGKKLFDRPSERDESFSDIEKPILIDNIEILLHSKLNLGFIDWLCVNKEGHETIISNIMQHNEAPTVERCLCLLLSYGMILHENDLKTVYREYGYHELFKILLHMDWEPSDYYYCGDKIPEMFYNISLDVPKMIKGRRSFMNEDLKKLSRYFTIPSDLLTGIRQVASRNRPRIPLLVELARDVFRKYFIEKFGIKNSRQFYTLVKLLPISTRHKAIITYEEKLY